MLRDMVVKETNNTDTRCRPTSNTNSSSNSNNTVITTSPKAPTEVNILDTTMTTETLMISKTMRLNSLVSGSIRL